MLGERFITTYNRSRFQIILHACRKIYGRLNPIVRGLGCLVELPASQEGWLGNTGDVLGKNCIESPGCTELVLTVRIVEVRSNITLLELGTSVMIQWRSIYVLSASLLWRLLLAA